MPYNYRQVSDVYQTLKDAGVTSDDLPTFASKLNDASGTQDYSAGLNDNWIKQGSVGLDKLLEATGLPTAGRALGTAAGSLVGAPDVGGDIGQGLPRMAMNFAPALLGPWGLLGVGALSGAETYTNTGSPAAGILSGLTNAAMPGVAGATERGVARAIGTKYLAGPITDALGNVTGQAEKYFPNAGQSIASFLGGQAAAAGLGEASAAGQAALDPNGHYQFSPTSTLLNMTLGQLPFAAAHLAGKVVGREANPVSYTDLHNQLQASQLAIQEKAARDAANTTSPVSLLPNVAQPTAPNPVVEAEINSRLAQIRGEKQQLAMTGDPDVIRRYDDLSNQELNLMSQSDKSGVMGEQVQPESDRFNVTGTTHFEKPGYRIIKVADDPNNVDQGYKSDQLIGYSTKFEPPVTPDEVTPSNNVYSVPKRFHDPNVVDNQAILDAAKVGTGEQPNLPDQPVSGLDKVREQMADFSRVKTQMDNVQEGDTEGMRQALEATNGMRQKWGYEPISDDQYAKRMASVGAKTPLDAAKGDVNSLMDRIAKKEQLMQQRAQEQAEAATRVATIKDEFKTSGQIDLDNLEVQFNKSIRAGSKPGLFDAVVNAWDQVGRPQSFEGLATRLAEAKRTGRVAPKGEETKQTLIQAISINRSAGTQLELIDGSKETLNPLGGVSTDHGIETMNGFVEPSIVRRVLDPKGKVVWEKTKPVLVKNDPLVTKTEAAVKVDSPATDHIRQLRASVADTVTEGINPDLEGDAQEFRAAFADGSLTLDSALKEFAKQDHVQEWQADAENELRKMGQNQGPTSRIADVPKPYVPQTPLEQSKVDALAPDTGGVGLVNKLYASSDPVTAGLARDLQQNFQEALKRVKVRILDMSREGYAQPFGNREVEIALSHGTVMNPDTVRSEQVMMHELLHGLTLAELDNPTKKAFVDELTELRQRLIERLPLDIRQKFEAANESNWLSRWANGDQSARMGDLAKSEPWQQIVYALLDNRELVSQGFTDPSVKKFMQSRGSEGAAAKGNVFVRWVKRLLGVGDKVQDNEFAHFLDITSNILTHGNWISDLSNFTDHWYSDKGLAPTVVRNLSRRALEVVQSSGLPLTKDSLNDFVAGEDPVTKAFADAKQAVTDMYKNGGEDADAAKAVLGELKQPLNSLDGLLTEHLGDRVSDMDSAMQMLPSQVTDYLFARAGDMKDVLESVKAALDDKNKGLINIADPTKLDGPVTQSLDAINKFLKYQAKDSADRLALGRLANVAPDAFMDLVLREPSAASGQAKDENGMLEKVGNAIGALGGRQLQKFLEQPAQIARSNPLFGEWYSKVLLMPGKIRQMAKASMDIFGRAIRPDGTLGPETAPEEYKKMYQALQSGKLQKALDSLIYLKQERGGAEVGPLDYNDPQVQQLMSGLNPEERQNLITLDNKTRLSKIAADQQTLESMRNHFATLAARLPMRDMGLKLDQATALSTGVFDAVNSDYSDPSQMQQANAQLAAIQSKMTPESFLNLLKFTQDSVAQHQIYRDYLSKNTDWASAQRNGSFLFEYTKNNKSVLSSAENKKEALQRSGGRPIENWRPNNSDEDAPVFLGSNAVDLISRLRELENNQTDMLSNVMSPEDIQQMQRTSPVAQFEREQNAVQRGIPLELKGRTLSKGAEELPWFENHIDWVQKNASYWQKRLLRAQGESMMMENGVQGTPTADLIRQHMDEMFQKDPAVGRAIQQVTSTWSLGFNFATLIVNSTQTFMRGVTELISLGHGPLAALGHLNGAWSDYIGHKVSDKPYRTGEEQRLLRDAAHEGQIDPTVFDSDQAEQAKAATNFKRVLAKGRPQDLGQYLSTAVGAYQTAGMMLFKHGERANHEVSILAAFRALKEKNPNLTYDELKRQAYLVNASVNDAGGRANRSLGLYSGKGDFARTVAMTMSSLQSYMLGSTFQLIRHLKAGLFRPQGLSPSEVYSARKAAIYQLATQFAAAGALGMPFVSGALALINQAFPELEVNKKLRESVSNLFQSDGDNGHIMTDMALGGVPSMMGWDWGSRMNAGNVLPGVSEYDGFQPEGLLGVPFSTVSNFIKGVKQLASGDPNGGYAFVPPGVRKLTQLAVNGGQPLDYKNRPLLSPLTSGERIGTAIGFNPTRLTQFNAADRMALQEQEQATRRQGQMNQQFAQQVLAGNFGTVRQSLIQQQQSDSTYNTRNAIRSIAQAAEDLQFPRDLRNQGSVGTSANRSVLLNSFNLDPSQTSEVARLQFRQGIEQRLGLVENDRQALVQAQVMDQLRAQQPQATTAQLRQAAAGLLRRTHPLLLGDQ